jgi:hypothetical protein
MQDERFGEAATPTPRRRRYTTRWEWTYPFGLDPRIRRRGGEQAGYASSSARNSSGVVTGVRQAKRSQT